jgi:glutamate synthase (NADPH/NADH) small chain
MAAHEAAAEAARCIYCYDAPCARACPAGIDVAAFIKKIQTKNLRGSARLLLSQNPLSASCARVCPTEELCTGRCVLPDMGVRPIDIGRLQRHVMDWAMARGDPEIPLGPSTGRRVSVVGAGPAGVACAVELRRRGHAVTIHDERERPGGLGTYAIAAHKMTPDFAVSEVEWLSKCGFLLRTATRVGEHVTFRELEETSDAVFIGVGLGVARRLEVEGEDLEGVVDALPLIAAHRAGGELPIALEGRRVVVLGGGNTAIDSALLATLLGASQVTIAYRRSTAEMPAYGSEVELARDRGVELLLLHAPRRLLGDRRVSGLELQPMRLGEPDASGRRRPVPVEEAAPVTLDCDVVVRALGQGVDNKLLAGIEGIRVIRGRIRVDPETGQTGNPRYYAGGDCVNGGREVVHAVAEGRRAALAIHKLLSEEV